MFYPLLHGCFIFAVARRGGGIVGPDPHLVEILPHADQRIRLIGIHGQDLPMNRCGGIIHLAVVVADRQVQEVAGIGRLVLAIFFQVRDRITILVFAQDIVGDLKKDLR